MTGPRFEVVRSKLTRQWRVRFIAGNHEIVVTTESYRSRASALHAIGVLKAHAADAPVDFPQDRP